MKRISLFSIIILIFSCQTEQEKALDQEKAEIDSNATMDSLFLAARKSVSAEKDSVKYNVSKKDSTLCDSDFDMISQSESRIHFDKNEVKWNKEEKNEFRIVFKKKLNKLIVYKNNIEFKTYHNPKIYIDLAESLPIKIMIYVDGKKIVRTNIGTDYAPNGFENYSEYYHLEQLRFPLLLEEVWRQK